MPVSATLYDAPTACDNSQVGTADWSACGSSRACVMGSSRSRTSGWMSTSVILTPYLAASRRARAVAFALAAPGPKYRAVDACGASLATAQLATTADESSPPHRHA